MNELLGVARIARKHVLTVTPLVDWLIIQVHIWLGQEGNKTIFYAQFDRRRASVLRTAGAPQIQGVALLMECANPRHNGGHGDALCPNGPDERVIHIYEYDALFHKTPNA
ncbi:hypothetical protein GCM10027430_35490 [Lysobacter tyrosinilyticus]